MTMRLALSSLLVAGMAAALAAQAPKPAAPKPATAAPAKPAAAAPAGRLTNPAALTAKAPEDFKVKFDTTKGPVLIELHRAWAPKGVDRFYNMVRNGYFTNVR